MATQEEIDLVERINGPWPEVLDVVLQDRDSSFNYGMPGAAKADGCADVVLDLHRIAPYLDAETGGD